MDGVPTNDEFDKLELIYKANHRYPQFFQNFVPYRAKFKG